MLYKKPTTWAYVIIAVFLLRSAITVNKPLVTCWDNFGYYLILPQTFIYKDPGNKDREAIWKRNQEYQLSTTLYQVHDVPNGNHISQYPLGMSFFYAPAFFTGHLIAKAGGYKADGYSPPYQYSLVWFEVIYVLLSFFLLIKVLRNFFAEWIVALLVLVCFFGTNYYIYVTSGRGMPHQYLFLLYVLLIHFTVKWTQMPKRKYAMCIGLILGLMTITRPTDALAFVIPLFWGVTGKESLKQKFGLLFKTHLKQTLLLVGCIFAVISIQLIYWKMYAGSFVHYSYINQREIFEFHRPHTIDFLFSYRKGWFVYTPVMLLGMVGLFMLIGKKTTYGTAFLIYTPITIYVLSSWSCWWYATSFGQRSMIQSYPIYLMCMGFLLQQLFSARNERLAGTFSTMSFQYTNTEHTEANAISPAPDKHMSRRTQRLVELLKRSMVIGFMCITTFFNQFQLWQVDRGIMQLDRVTKDYYWAVFGKTEYPQGVDTLLMIEHAPARALQLPYKWRYKPVGIKNPNRKPDSSNVYFLSKDPKTWPHIEFVAGDMQDEQHAWYKVSFEFKLMNPADSVKCTLIETMVDEHVRGFGWESFPFYADAKKKENGWMRYENYYLTPVKVLGGDLFSTYLWFEGENRLYLRRFKVEIFKLKNQ